MKPINLNAYDCYELESLVDRRMIRPERVIDELARRIKNRQIVGEAPNFKAIRVYKRLGLRAGYLPIPFAELPVKEEE